jgi:hypothetical protein
VDEPEAQLRVADESNENKGSAAKLFRFGVELIRLRKHIGGISLGLVFEVRVLA